MNNFHNGMSKYRNLLYIGIVCFLYAMRKLIYYIYYMTVPPMLSIPNQLEGAYIGQDVTLECHTEAYPSSINYWTTDRGDMIISGETLS